MCDGEKVMFSFNKKSIHDPENERRSFAKNVDDVPLSNRNGHMEFTSVKSPSMNGQYMQNAPTINYTEPRHIIQQQQRMSLQQNAPFIDDEIDTSQVNDATMDMLLRTKQYNMDLYLSHAGDFFDKADQLREATKSDALHDIAKSIDLANHSESLERIRNAHYFPDNIKSSHAIKYSCTVEFKPNTSMPNNIVRVGICDNDTFGRGMNIFGFGDPANDIENCVLADIRIVYAYNNSPYTIGIKITHQIDKKEVCLDGKLCKRRENNEWYHYIIHAGSKVYNDGSMYKNTSTVNHEYAKVYPWLTPSEKSIDTGVESLTKGLKLVPIEHPVSRHICENAHLNTSWSLPELSPEPRFKGMYMIPTNIYAEARTKLLDVIRSEFPVINMRDLALIAEPIRVENRGDSIEFGGNAKGAYELDLMLLFVYAFRVD
jgi:hypothetical protein